ncbi:MAG TPA: ATP-binding protein [Candidatus Binatia bacterium]|nr:ATP-binding protein [Candidatus Binatia bacterium]
MRRPWAPRGIRGRLTLWYAAALAAALALCAGGMLAFVRHGLYAHLDRDLRDDVEVAEDMLARVPGGGVAWRSAPDEDDTELLAGRWLEVRSPSGRLLFARPRPIPRHVRVRRYAESGAVQGLPVVIVAARSEEPLRRQLAELLLGMVLALPLAAGLAALGGWALARRALRPLADMAARARAITADRLEERLVAEDPQDELGRLAAVFNDMLARLQRSFEELQRFTADASHELRTPLAAMRAVGEVALGAPRSDGEYREVIGSMLEEADRLASLVDGLLTLSRADGGEVVLRRERVDLVGLAHEVAGHLGVLAEERGQTVAVTAAGSVGVDADRLVLRRALVNLVDNAIKYTPVGGRVEVTVGSEDGRPTVAVTDTGPGIAAAHRERIFDRFYRVDTARARDGAGLGLAIARWAVEANGGRIEVRGAQGQGATFRIVFGAR